MTTARGYPALRLGVVDAESGDLEVSGPFDGETFVLGLDDLRAAWSHTIPARFAHHD
ncbi:MAG TPA: hypothetical protein H9871_03460 [Candidatus Nesterenkonia stercoripullorum]|uniref:Uncharacterized protein n=1 Tax=Candidatus Nesterenkonia stercoripullorum TaxID=2838701 RepID=A0A9D1S1T2_9MICC|nr:hypothetical protein [Candidatus Nesterenkonia stercoripullorum]